MKASAPDSPNRVPNGSKLAVLLIDPSLAQRFPFGSLEHMPGIRGSAALKHLAYAPGDRHVARFGVFRLACPDLDVAISGAACRLHLHIGPFERECLADPQPGIEQERADVAEIIVRRSQVQLLLFEAQDELAVSFAPEEPDAGNATYQLPFVR